MTIKVRSTDASTARPMPHLILTAEDARNAPSPTWHCGWCPFATADTDHKAIANHRCVSLSGQDMTEVKMVHAQGARNALKAIKIYPIPPCMYCGLVSGPGASHDCPGHSGRIQPVDAAAAAFQRQGALAQFAAELEELKRTSK